MHSKVRVILSLDAIRNYEENLLPSHNLLICRFGVCTYLRMCSVYRCFPPAIPVLSFVKELTSQEVTEGSSASLCCETSIPDASVTWKKGTQVLSDGKKYSIKRDGSIQTLEIHKLSVDDGGEYICEAGDKRSKATLTVKGNNLDSSLEMAI